MITLKEMLERNRSVFWLQHKSRVGKALGLRPVETREKQDEGAKESIDPLAEQKSARHIELHPRGDCDTSPR